MSTDAGEISGTGPHFVSGELVAGAYLIRSVIGSGGMGQVYAADDLDLRRLVAIKTNYAGGGEFLRMEAQALAQVHHRNVVAVQRLGIHRGVTFMVMERLCGRSMLDHIVSQHFTGRPIELDDALELLGGVAAGLAALHDAGIAHLDLKPANVMICAERRVVLVDLGVMLPEVLAGDRTPCGTPMYMAPELVEGVLQPGRACLADIYSFGALAFELVTGQPVFRDGEPVCVLTSQLADTPCDVRELRPDVPPRLAALIRSCLAKDAYDRPASAEEIAWELRALRDAIARAPARRPSLRSLAMP